MSLKIDSHWSKKLKFKQQQYELLQFIENFNIIDVEIGSKNESVAVAKALFQREEMCGNVEILQLTYRLNYVQIRNMLIHLFPF